MLLYIDDNDDTLIISVCLCVCVCIHMMMNPFWNIWHIHCDNNEKFFLSSIQKWNNEKKTVCIGHPDDDDDDEVYILYIHPVIMIIFVGIFFTQNNAMIIGER